MGGCRDDLAAAAILAVSLAWLALVRQLQVPGGDLSRTPPRIGRSRASYRRVGMAEAVQHVVEAGWASAGRCSSVTGVPMRDEELVRAAAAGDREAFAEFLESHYDRIFRFCFRLTGRREEAEDLTQDICSALPAKLRSFRRQARVTTWLYRIAVNAAHDRRRRAVSRTKAVEGWGDWEVNRRAAATDRAADLDWLRRAMTALPEDLRETVALTVDGEMTHREAAEVLGVSEGTVSWRLSEVRKRLRAMRQEEERR